MKKLKKEYKNLEKKVLNNLRDKIKKSKKYSKHINEKCIEVNLFDYTEITILNDRITFIDEDGLHYHFHSHSHLCNLEDLIDILNGN